MMFTLALILGTALAIATAAPLTIDFTVRDRATVERDGSVVVRGTVTCSAETTVSIEGLVVEELNRSNVATGMFAVDVICESTPTPWTARVTADTDVPFRPGFASIGLQATAFDPESGIFSGVESSGFVHLTRSGR
jgi:hypothetical protein